MPDNRALAPTHDAIGVWRNMYFRGHVPTIGIPSENTIYRLMRGTPLSSGPDVWDVSELERTAEAVQEAVSYLKWRYDTGQYAKDWASPFIAHHLHVINGERVKGNPSKKAEKLGLTRRTYYRYIDNATEFIHSVLST